MLISSLYSYMTIPYIIEVHLFHMLLPVKFVLKGKLSFHLAFH